MRKVVMAVVAMTATVLFPIATFGSDDGGRVLCSYGSRDTYVRVLVDENRNASLLIRTSILVDREYPSIIPNDEIGREADFSISLPIVGPGYGCERMRFKRAYGMAFFAWASGITREQHTEDQVVLIVAQVHPHGVSIWDEIPVFEQSGEERVTWGYEILEIHNGLQLDVFEEGCFTCGTYNRYYPDDTGDMIRETGEL